jgi:hypothetical protein
MSFDLSIYVVAPQGFEPRLIGSEPCLLLFHGSTVNYLELPRRRVFTGDRHHLPTFNYRDLLPLVLSILPGIFPGTHREDRVNPGQAPPNLVECVKVGLPAQIMKR